MLISNVGDQELESSSDSLEVIRGKWLRTSGWHSAHLSFCPNVRFHTSPHRIDLFYFSVSLFITELLELPFLCRVILI